MENDLVKKLMAIEGVQKAREIKSQTKAKAILLKIDDNFYTVVAIHPPPGVARTMGYRALKNGKIIDYKEILSIVGKSDLYLGAYELIMILKGNTVLNERMLEEYQNYHGR